MRFWIWFLDLIFQNEISKMRFSIWDFKFEIFESGFASLGLLQLGFGLSEIWVRSGSGSVICYWGWYKPSFLFGIVPLGEICFGNPEGCASRKSASAINGCASSASSAHRLPGRHRCASQNAEIRPETMAPRISAPTFSSWLYEPIWRRHNFPVRNAPGPDADLPPWSVLSASPFRQLAPAIVTREVHQIFQDADQKKSSHTRARVHHFFHFSS